MARKHAQTICEARGWHVHVTAEGYGRGDGQFILSRFCRDCGENLLPEVYPSTSDRIVERNESEKP